MLPAGLAAKQLKGKKKHHRNTSETSLKAISALGCLFLSG